MLLLGEQLSMSMWEVVGLLKCGSASDCGLIPDNYCRIVKISGGEKRVYGVA